MPTISIFFGFVVQMYWRDHPPPHVHVLYQGFKAAIAIETGELIAGNLPPGALRTIRVWIRLRSSELLVNWERARQKRPLVYVPGMDDHD
jgi:Domain of unknown function (DUF4160)